jgi:hypothetical protein
MEVDMGKPEPPADKTAVPENLLDLVRLGIGGDIEILGFPAEEKVANPSADEVSEMARLLEAVQYPYCILADPLAGDGMV